MSRDGILTEQEIKDKKEVLDALAKALCALTSLQDEGIKSEDLYQGIVVFIEDEVFDSHEYLVKLLPEPLNV